MNLCFDNWQVKSSLLSADGQVLEKNDQTPVTVADFGVQALVSLGNKKLHCVQSNWLVFPIIILVV